MSNQKTLMKAPENTSSEASIEGHQYTIPKSGVIEVVNPAHIPVLRRLGFVEHYEDPADVETLIDGMDDKDDLVQFIEERGGDADNSMSLKKLRRLAKEAASDNED